MTNIIQLEDNPFSEVPTAELVAAVNAYVEEASAAMAKAAACLKELSRRGAITMEASA